MPRPRPTTDQRQHIIRCDDKLWKKIATAATKAGVPINVYLNRLLEAAMAAPVKGAIDTVIDTDKTIERKFPVSSPAINAKPKRATKDGNGTPERHVHVATHQEHGPKREAAAEDGRWWHTHPIVYGTVGHGGKAKAKTPTKRTYTAIENSAGKPIGVIPTPRPAPVVVTPATTAAEVAALRPTERAFVPFTKQMQAGRPPKASAAKPKGKT